MINLKKNRLKVLTSICLGWFLLFLVPNVVTKFSYELFPEPFSGIVYSLKETTYLGENAIRDFFARSGKKAPIDEDLVYLAVDNTSVVLDHLWLEDFTKSEELRLMKEGWPWNRKVHGMILEKLFNAGAKAIAVDFLFLSTTEADPYLKAVFDKYKDRIVVGGNYVLVDTVVGQNVVSILKFDMPADSIIPHKDPLDSRIVYVNVPEDDEGGMVRRIQYEKETGTISLSSGLLKVIDEDQYVSGFTNERLIRFGGFANEGYLPHPVSNLFVDSIWQNNYKNGTFFKDKIIVYGPHGNWSQDYHLTPVGNMPGPEIHLNAIASGRGNYFIKEVGNFTEYLLLFLAAFIAWIISILIKQPFLRMIMIVMICMLHLGLQYYLYNEFSIFLYSFMPVLVFASSSTTCLIAEYVVDRLEKNQLRSQFELYVSKNVVKQMLDAPEDYMNTLGGVRKPVTVFFSDVRGFTTLTEGSDSQKLVNQLNEYFTSMVDCVFEYEGTLDKFIGDAIMAVWGNTTSHGADVDAKNAIRATLAMKRGLKQLNESWLDRGMIPFGIGMGLNHGEVIVGNMGSLKKKEFTVIGDAVNLAARLEGVTKQYGVEICIGEDLANLVEDEFILQRVDFIKVKGKTKPVEVFTIHDEKNEADLYLYSWLSFYEEGISLYRRRKFREAEEKFGQALALEPNDSLSDLYIRRCREYQMTPPEKNWDGVYEMSTK